MAVILFVGGRTDKPDVTRLQIGFQHVRCIHRTVARSTGSHQGMYLVDIDNVRHRLRRVVLVIGDTVHNLLDAVLEVAAILRAGQERSHV